MDREERNKKFEKYLHATPAERRKFDLSFLNEPSLPEGLDEAAREYSKKCYCPILKHKDGIGLNCSEIETALKAGAEWQKVQDQKTIELAEDHAMLAGMNKMEKQMLEEAMEGMVCATITGTNAISFLSPLPDELNAGDKVKIIVIKED